MVKTKHGRQTSSRQEMNAQMHSHIAYRKAMSDKFVEKWSKTNLGGKKLLKLYHSGNPGKERARRTAWALEMQERYLKSMRETVISTNFQTKPENVLRIVRIGSANSNRGNVFTEYPLETTDDAIFYLQFTREQALRGATAGEFLYDTARPYYGGEVQPFTVGTGNGISTAFSGTVPVFPVVPFSVRLVVGGTLVGNDDGAGNITSTLLNTSLTNTIVYATGVVTLNFTSAVTNGSTVIVIFDWDSEQQSLYSQYGTVGINIQKRRFNARPQPLGYNYTRMTELLLGTHGFGDANEMFITAVGDEHAKRKDFRSIILGRQVATNNTTEHFDADFASAGEVSDKAHAQRYLSKVRGISGTVYNQVERGNINRIVAGSGALTYIQKHDLWQTDKTQPRVGGTYFAGYLDDIEVYAVVADISQGLLDNNETLLVYKNEQQDGDLAIAWGVLTELSDQLAFPQHRVEGYISTVEDFIVFQQAFCRLLVIDNLTF